MKGPYPILVAPLPIVTLVRLVQYASASTSMSLTLLGTVMLPRLVQ